MKLTVVDLDEEWVYWQRLAGESERGGAALKRGFRYPTSITWKPAESSKPTPRLYHHVTR